MRLVLCALVPLLIPVITSGCNTVDPSECWLNTTGGFGGSGSLPIGAGVGATSSGGDFLSPPPYNPQDHADPPNPCIEPQGPCSQKCQTDYENWAAACGKLPDEAQRKTCQEEGYPIYKSCREACVQSGGDDCLELCREQCDKSNVKCIKNCAKGDIPCMARCNEANGRCLKECSQRCK